MEDVLPCNLPCPKCGSVDVGRLFYAKGDQVPSKGYDRCGNRYASGQSHYFRAFSEHLAHHCRCCQHDWQTLPLKKRKKAA
jgi:hypothetical protein